MRPRLALLALLLAPAPASATPVTAYAMGQVTRDFFTPDHGTSLYDFAIGEHVFLRILYDLDPPRPGELSPVSIAVDMESEFGFRRTIKTTPLARSRGSEVGGVLRLSFDSDPIGFALVLGESTGTATFTRDSILGSEGFAADIVRVADDSAFPSPEPSTLALGMVGMTLIGITRWRIAA